MVNAPFDSSVFCFSHFTTQKFNTWLVLRWFYQVMGCIQVFLMLTDVSGFSFHIHPWCCLSLNITPYKLTYVWVQASSPFAALPVVVSGGKLLAYIEQVHHSQDAAKAAVRDEKEYNTQGDWKNSSKSKKMKLISASSLRQLEAIIANWCLFICQRADRRGWV